MLSKGGIAVLALVIAFAAGWRVHAWKVASDNQKSVADAQRNSGLLQRSANQADVATRDRLAAERDAAYERSKKLEARLASSARELNSCRIDADTLRVLNAGNVPGDARAAVEPERAGADVASGSTCAELARTFDENHKRFDACTITLGACQAFYVDVRAEYCRKTKAC